MPTPAALGMPPQFTAWRPGQEAAFEMFERATTRVKALCSPTGSGKSITFVADALRSGKPTCFVTDSRALQDQLLTTFERLGLVDLRGRANYACCLKPEDPTYSCEDGYAARCPNKGTHRCEASQAEMRASASKLVVTNYAKWIHARKHGQGLAHIQRVVFDEGHNLLDALSSAMQVTLHAKEIEERLGVNFPSPHEAQFFATWRPWAVETRRRCESLLKKAQNKIQGCDAKVTWVRDFTHLRNLMRRLNILATAAPDNWVVHELPHGYQFDPINPARYAESALFLRVPEILVVSATLRPKSLQMVGLKPKDYTFLELLSDFDPARCPTYYIPTMRVDARAKDLSQLWLRLDQIAAPRRDRNGLVHTISYTRRDEVVAQSRFASSMLVNEKGDPATDMIETFKRQYPGAILVSPSVGQGFDFAFKAAEWQFICKVPFPPPSKILTARTERDAEYPYYLAMQKLVQAAGRIMRDKEDQGETFLADDHLAWFLPRYGHLAPKSFGQFFKRITSLPPPPRRLGGV